MTFLSTLRCLAPLALFPLLFAGCKSHNDGHNNKEAAEVGAGSVPAAPAKISLNGAGATFPFPLYSKWMSEYNKLNPSVQINYQSIGSGGGVRQVTAGTVDFGASDAPAEPEALAKASGLIDHIPTTLGAVTVAYNLPSLTAELKLDSQTLTGIFQGDVKKWNDPKIAATNEGVALPAQNITVIYRSDGSGTTSVFTDYLAAVSASWKEKVGAGKSVRWPTGLGAKGNEGVTGQVKVTPGSIGYIELAYALQNKLSMASLKNKAGAFIKPGVASVSAAAAGVTLPDSLTASLVDAAGAEAYPISAFTYLLVYREAKEQQKGESLARFVWWALHDGQKYAQALDYAPLPPPVVAQVEARLKQLSFHGKPLLAGN